MPFPLRRTTDAPDLDLARAHAEVAAPRRGVIAWDTFDRSLYADDALREAAHAWSERAEQEYHSLALFTQLASQLHVLGAPLDWAGAFVRMTGDEVRHTELCARLAELFGGAAPAGIDEARLHIHPTTAATPLRAHVRDTVIAAFCIGETLSGRMFRRCLRAATVEVAKDVVRAIADDETFHGRFGWELGALLMRRERDGGPDDRASLAGSLPALFAHYRRLCGAAPGEAWARAEPEASPDPNFGTLTRAGYARAFFDGMREDVVPGLVAIGLPEATVAWERVAVASM